jgi:hypothetical protein
VVASLGRSRPANIASKNLVAAATLRRFRHRNLDDLAVLVDCAVDVAPHTSHLHIGFVDKPAITNTVTTRPRCVDHERSEALHPSVDGDVVDLDAALGEKFFDIAVRESVAQVPAHRQQDHVRWKPESRKRRRSRAAATTTTNHPGTLRPHPIVNATVPTRRLSSRDRSEGRHLVGLTSSR